MAVVFTGINSQQEKKRQNLSSKWHRNKTDFVHANLEKTISAVKKVRCFFKFGVCENGICVEKSLLLYIYAYIYTWKKKKKKKTLQIIYKCSEKCHSLLQDRCDKRHSVWSKNSLSRIHLLQPSSYLLHKYVHINLQFSCWYVDLSHS